MWLCSRIAIANLLRIEVIVSLAAIVQDLSYLLTHFHLYTTLCLINLWIRNIPGTESLLEIIQAEEEGDQTHFPQFFLIFMTKKGPEYMLYQNK
jgi:hypothetical protein